MAKKASTSSASKRRPKIGSAVEKFLSLSDAERERIASEFDQEHVAESFTKLSAAQMAKWERAKRKRGRPSKGEGADAVNITVERGLLRRVDEYAKAAGLNRSQLIAMGLKLVLAR